MFGESESESPRVPSPWDSLISTPPSPASRSSTGSSSPFSIELIPCLVPEADEGNVEYKLQLLSPSPSRFARLVTQLKWRLLEGGGQAYYELGVADSGALVGLPRTELEQSLETLEMMAGEIGASVIVVKEIEVPAAMAGLAASQTDKWNGQRKQREPRPGSGSSTALLSSESETETTTTDYDEDDLEDMSTTIVLEKSTGTAAIHSSSAASHADPDPADNADAEDGDDPRPTYIATDLEIFSVFKPRPMRSRVQMHAHDHVVAPTKTKRLKRIKHITHPNSMSDSEHPETHANGKPRHSHPHPPADPATKVFTRRQMRDRKREEKRKALAAYATAAVSPPSPSPSPGPVPLTVDEELGSHYEPTPAETSALVSGLAALHVSLSEPAPPTQDARNLDDVFASPTAVQALGPKEGVALGSRLIVEALVVRKMSLDEAFLDFGGFALV
ncbi:hypothetical protein DXG03_001859 [Asterophora parasitica]|uniref:GTP binding protein 2 n=1 Tax=Asterophora parasitica TaxID=117018 RepID=A0A9P7K905_9AGAR|nr:hypothetical protein DXG03_001859 [Asterophora parasitica]